MLFKIYTLLDISAITNKDYIRLFIVIMQYHNCNIYRNNQGGRKKRSGGSGEIIFPSKRVMNGHKIPNDYT